MTDKLDLAIIGATGRTGVPLVAQAVQRGHRVRALIRDSGKADRLPSEADVVTGDATFVHDLARLVAGADVVLDVSGPVKGGPNDYRTTSTTALLRALADHPDTGLIHLAGAGVRRPGDQPGVMDRLVRGLMTVVAGALLRDSSTAVEAVEAADRRTLVVRGPRLTEGQPTGAYRTAPAVGNGSGMQITRADLATALLDLAETDRWPDGSPVISA